ncbi:flagellin N-terminal helical domain-containing protein [Leptospira sp. GIMC2001]|uniref:flagellin N-terminal helical domain-containing protein n=1 Tax=Leptospira sp. GIMC2001 TaxID=1513297 RepID=UPI0004A5C404|nr:flagellin [Leptospira sp. GIMC2001]AID56255.1 flagellin protein FlaA [Leptospira sp. GIMC2001]WCL48133.1 flagellin [Leptospira sp. GIMC2001]
MKINHNISALTSNRVLKETNNAMDKSMERLSTGMRINRPGDDAPSFAVSERLRTQIRGLAQAERNAQDGLSFLQVTEGSLDQVNGILQRLRELSVQTANGIYSTEDRQLVQLEVSQLIEEVDRIGKTAEFNRIRPLDGRFSRALSSPMLLHVGANQDEKLSIYIGTMNASTLKLTNGEKKSSLSTPANANDLISLIDDAIGKVNKQRAELGAYYNRLELTIGSLSNNYVSMVASESRIRDADMAEEVVEFVRNQVLTKSGTAMVAQANSRPDQVIKLLSDRFG